MIFPIGDDQVKGGAKPYFSYGLIVLNVLFFFVQLSFPDALICELGSIPNDIMGGKGYHTLFTSMFMHGGWMHLIGNMLFLWVFADNIEATVGNFTFLFFYLMGGLAASAVHILLSVGGDPAALLDCCSVCARINCTGNMPVCAGSIPSVGASGAISAVLGAYLVMFPKSKVKVLIVYFFSSFRVAAIWFLGFWIVQQLISGFAALGPETAATSGVAWWAHIGGFAFGVIAGFVVRNGNKGKGPEPKIKVPKPPKYGDQDFV